jgi:rSAM/selenodomain-associated transferase 2
MPKLSIIIPTLDEEHAIVGCLLQLASLRARGAEVIVVDAGSRDKTVRHAQPLCDAVLVSAPGRAQQMNAGAAHACGTMLLFLHADCSLPAGADQLIADALAPNAKQWGRFDIAISGAHALFPVIAWFMNCRSRLTGIATGDQAIFVARDTFGKVGGFPVIALMEDIAICKALRKISAPACIAEPVTTSGRRWEKHGALRTILLMWRLRLAFFLGADPNRLARDYYGGARQH